MHISLITATIIFLGSKICEEIFAWLKLPAVLGQLICGLILGVSALNILAFSETESVTVNQSIIELIQWSTAADKASATAAYSNQLIAISEGAANLGAIALLFLIGLESDFEKLLQVGTKSAIVAVSGVILPFVGGIVGLIYLFQVSLVPAIFAGAALTQILHQEKLI